MNSLVRVAAKQAAHPDSKKDFMAGVLAYNNVLWELRISVLLLLVSLALLIFFPVRRKKS
jgi:hypothetical protein